MRDTTRVDILSVADANVLLHFVRVILKPCLALASQRLRTVLNPLLKHDLLNPENVKHATLGRTISSRSALVMLASLCTRAAAASLACLLASDSCFILSAGATQTPIRGRK